MILTWIGPDGDEWDLTEDNGISLLVGTAGLDVPPVVLDTFERVGADGAAYGGLRYAAKRFTLVLDVLDVSADQRARSIIGAMARRFTGPGTLRYQDDVNIRELRQVFYESGLEGEETELPAWRRVAVNLVALDPLWYSTAQVVSLAISGTAIPWNSTNPWNAALPWNGGATVAVVVEGDAPAFPVVDAFGPYTQITVSLADGVGWQSTAAAVAGQRLTVDHRPGFRGPKAEGAAFVDWSLLTEASRLWSLPPGDRTIIVGITGDTGVTTATLTWEPRWLTP